MKKEIINLIEQRKYAEIKNQLIEMNVVDVAQLIEELDKQNMLIVFRLLPKDFSAEVFSYVSTDLQRDIVESMSDAEIKSILDQMFLDDTVDFLEEMPSNVVKKVLKNANESTRKLINQFLNYPEDSAGSIMTIEFVDLKKEMTAEQAIRHIKETGVDKETIDTCYVIDKERRLEGAVFIRKLILSKDSIIVKDIMDTNIIYVSTNDDREKAASLFKKYDLLSMPVVDNEDRLVGIVTVDDIIDVISQENTEDLQRMAAMVPTGEEYLKKSKLTLAKHRIPWLLILMISASLTGGIIRKFDNVLQSTVLLASFIPMLMDTGGNSGTQSSTLVIRGMALGEIGLKDVFKVLWKEFRVSCIAGLVLSSLSFLRIYFLEKVDLLIALTVCTTLFFVVIIAKLLGGLLPIVAKTFKADPAIMASPLITTIVDTAALLIYFAMATWLLNI